MTKTNYLLILFILSIFACKENKPTKESNADTSTVTKTETTPPAIQDTISTPNGYKILGEAVGNLNQDSLDEKIIVYDTGRELEFGTEREMQIFHKVKNRWTLWHKSTGALLPSEGGGVWGDPFEAVSIQNNCIVLEHFGGSRQKWKYTNRYRHQNDTWQLIGATVVYGAPCDTWEDFDYNLSTGKINYKKKTETCNGDKVIRTKINANQSLVKKLDLLPEMDTFSPGESPVDVLGNGEMFYY